MAVKTYKKGDTTKLSENFSVYEFSCNGKGCCSETPIDDNLVKYLQMIRDHFGAEVTISCGHRCATYNAKVKNAAKKSKHIDGLAADIKVAGVKPIEVAKYAESIGVKGIGHYDTFVHIDTRTKKSFWYSHAQEYRSTFGGSVKTKESTTVLEWQKAALSDGFDFPKYGADGSWGSECESVAKSAVVKRRIQYRYKNLTKIVQKAVGAEIDGLCGFDTEAAIKAYQKANGLTADGIVGINTWKKILGV